MRPRPAATGSLLAGTAAAFGASACCAGPLLLVLGVGGAWGSRLTALRPFQPLFVVISIAFFTVAFRRLYAKSEECAVSETCAVPSTRRRQRFIFWVVMPAALALMSFPLYAPLFY